MAHSIKPGVISRFLGTKGFIRSTSQTSAKRGFPITISGFTVSQNYAGQTFVEYVLMDAYRMTLKERQEAMRQQLEPMGEALAERYTVVYSMPEDGQCWMLEVQTR